MPNNTKNIIRYLFEKKMRDHLGLILLKSCSYITANVTYTFVLYTI